MTLLTDPASNSELDDEVNAGAQQVPAGPSLEDQLNLLSDEQIGSAFPALNKASKLLQASRIGNVLPILLTNLLLVEEVRRDGGDVSRLSVWRGQRWGSRVEQAFVLQRKRFQRISYYQLVLKTRGEATEYYYQLCNQEVQFEDLLKQFHPAKAGKQQQGIMHNVLLESMPKALAKKLRKAPLGQPLQPIVTGKASLLLQVIQRHEPELDQSIRELLEKEVEQQWLQNELQRRLEAIQPLTSFQPATTA